MHMRTCRSRTFATIAVLAAFPFTARAQTPTEPLKLTLTCEQAFSSPFAFRLTLQNVSPEPSRAIIGTMHGRFFEVSSLAFAVSRAGVADTDFEYLDPSMPEVMPGTGDPWLILLAAGGSYSVVISLPPRLRELLSTPAGVRVRLTSQTFGTLNLDVQGLPGFPVWAGTLRSDPIDFPDACRR